MSFSRNITSPIPARVDIDAAFTMAGPATGAVDPEGNVVVDAVLTVDLHIEVRPPGGGLAFLVADCRAAPVRLSLASLAPYDPGTGRVTLDAPDFTVPAVSSANPCGSIIAGPVNDELAGPGHSLRLVLQGAIELPPPPGDPSVTTLSVDPAGGSRLGQTVTLIATVTPGEGAEATEAPGGFVDFLDGRRLLGTVALDAGTAQLTTAGLAVGPRQLQARYRGQDPYRASTAAITHTVASAPLINLDLPPFVTYGGDPVPVGVTVANTTLGSDVANGRLAVTVSRAQGTGALTPGRVVLEHLVDGVWEPVATTQPATRVVQGLLGGATGFLLPAGAEVTEQLRISFPPVGASPSPTSCGSNNPTCPGPFTVAIEVLPVDPASGGSGPALARVDGTLPLVEAQRRPPTLALALGGTPLPRTTRQGRSVDFAFHVGPARAGVGPTGTVEVAVDGVPVPIRAGNMPLSAGYLDRLPLHGTGAASIQMLLPPRVAVGTRQVTIAYSGDALYRPGTLTTDITVLPSLGIPYECTESGFTQTFRFGANVVASALLPSHRPAGSSLDLAGLQVEILTSRLGISDPIYISHGLNEVGGSPVDGLGFDFGPGGSGSATAVERTGGSRQPTAPYPAPEAEVDQVLDLRGEVGTVTLAGSPGDRVPVTLDSVVVDYSTGAFPRQVRCAPVGEPVTLGEVTLTGVALVVTSEADPVRVGDEVTLAASVVPAMAGTVEVRDGARTVGVAPVGPDGTTVVSTTGLEVGGRSLTARFHAATAMPVLVSEAVPLVVLPAVDCESFAVEGSGAVVRLVYMELLGRCPDQAGYAFWVGRLDGGTSPEVFARTIAATPEAVGRVVDDAYVTMLGRRADGPGRAFWTGRLLAHGRYDALLADLGASEEFWVKAGSSDTGFVTRVYERLLQRAPDQVGHDHWVGRLAAGTSRRALVVGLSTLDEPLRVLVVGSYDEIVGRAPSSGERSRGIAYLRRTGDRSGLYAQIIGTGEFFDRAQGFPNPED